MIRILTPTIEQVQERMREDADVHRAFDLWVKQMLISSDSAVVGQKLLHTLKEALCWHSTTPVEVEDDNEPWEHGGGAA